MASKVTYTIEDLPPHEQLIACPYNSAHKVVAKRMHTHLIKCRKSHSTQGTATCRFNVSHVVREEDIIQHEVDCPDRILVDNFVQYIGKAEKEKSLKLEESSDSGVFNSSNSFDNQSTGSCLPLDEQLWDNDFSPTYNPKKAIEEKAAAGIIIRTHIQHGLPSERRKLRAEQTDFNNAIKKEQDMKVEGNLAPPKNPSINWKHAEQNYDHHNKKIKKFKK